MIRIRSEKDRMKEVTDVLIRGLILEDENAEIDADDLLFVLSNAYEHVTGEGLDINSYVNNATQQKTFGTGVATGMPLLGASAGANLGSAKKGEANSNKTTKDTSSKKSNEAGSSQKKQTASNTNKQEAQNHNSQSNQQTSNKNKEQKTNNQQDNNQREEELSNVKNAVKDKKQEHEQNNNSSFFDDIPEPDDIGGNSNHPNFNKDVVDDNEPF